jgi:ABC-type antimicrobial peptide transport system permease subunit
LPLTGTASIYVSPADRPKPTAGEEPRSLVRVVSPDYFRVMSIPLLQGRGFSAGDSASSPRVALVNENLAHLFFGDDNPVGRRLTILSGGSATIPVGTVQIVGLARNTREVGVDEVRFNDVYLPFDQAPQRSMYVAAKTTARPDEVASVLRRDLRSLDPNGAIYGVLTMEQRISDYLAGARFNLALIALFAGLAMLLAGVGVYGAIAFSVAQRTREFGLRMALGARPLSILSLTLNRTARLTLAGAGCGLVLAWILGALLNRAMYLVPGEHGGMLYGVGIHDPASFGGAAAIMLGLAAIAGLLPAARAAKLDPVIALRHD